MLTHLDLFSGIGGFALAARACGFETVGFCEIEPYAQQVLKEKFGAVVADANAVRCGRRSDNEGKTSTERDRITPSLHGDIYALDGTSYREVTLITGGFPCQPFSVAGKRRGKEDNRHLWPEMLRVINQARPAWVLGENVAGIVNMELDSVLSDLEGIGYACRPFIIPACAVDARHRRDRVWIVAHSNRKRRRCRDSEWENAIYVGQSSQDPKRCNWLPEPDVGRVAHGIPARAHRLRALGNAIVPQVAQEILRVIAEIETKP